MYHIQVEEAIAHASAPTMSRSTYAPVKLMYAASSTNGTSADRTCESTPVIQAQTSPRTARTARTERGVSVKIITCIVSVITKLTNTGVSRRCKMFICTSQLHAKPPNAQVQRARAEALDDQTAT